MDCRLPDSFVPGISQEEYWSGISEWFPPFPLLNALGGFSPVFTGSTRVPEGKSQNIVGGPSDWARIRLVCSEPPAVCQVQFRVSFLELVLSGLPSLECLLWDLEIVLTSTLQSLDLPLVFCTFYYWLVRGDNSRDLPLSLWSGDTDSKNLDYQKMNPRKYQIVRTHTKETTVIQDPTSPNHK